MESNLLWVPAALGLIWMLGPLVLFWSPLRRQERRPLPDPPPVDDPELARRIDEYRARGLELSGWVRSRCWFFTPVHWRFSPQPEAWLTSADGKTHVALYRPSLAERPTSTCAWTAFEGAGPLSTRPSAARARVARLYLLAVAPLFAVLMLASPVRHRVRSGDLASLFLQAVVVFAVARVLVLPEFSLRVRVTVTSLFLIVSLLLLGYHPPWLSFASASMSAVSR
jgi:hypothetical protein